MSGTGNKPAPTNAPWQTYKWEEPATPEPAPAPAKEEVWSKYLTAKTKCERPHGLTSACAKSLRLVVLYVISSHTYMVGLCFFFCDARLFSKCA